VATDTATAPAGAAALRTRVGEELARPAPEAAQRLTRAILERHDGGRAIASVLFYGSCLRRATHEGVLDFYVLVDSYRAFHGAGLQALANWCLPPTVFYLECDGGALGSLRTKYAVISLRDFERAVRPGCPHPYIWSRFAQPALQSHARDEHARSRVVAAVARAVVTFVQRLTPFQPARGRVQRFSLAALWQEGFRRTYAAEFRSESPETIRSHYLADPERYDAAGREALEALVEEGWLEDASPRGRAVEVTRSPARRRLARARWAVMRVVGRTLQVLRLLKTAFTFGDWVPYALWKIERHTGEPVATTERQRRHPLVFGWPVVFRLLRRRGLR